MPLHEQSPDGIGKLFVGGIAFSTTEESLRKHFGSYGRIADCVVLSDRATNKPRGFAFVQFEDPGLALAVAADTHIIDGRQVDVKVALPREDIRARTDAIVDAHRGQRTSKIFVGGLSPNTTDETFYNFFAKLGEIEEAVVMLEPGSLRSRGFGFVTYSSEEAVEAVFASGTVYQLDGNSIEVKPAVRRDALPKASRKGSWQPRRGRPGEAGLAPPMAGGPLFQSALAAASGAYGMPMGWPSMAPVVPAPWLGYDGYATSYGSYPAGGGWAAVPPGVPSLSAADADAYAAAASYYAAAGFAPPMAYAQYGPAEAAAAAAAAGAAAAAAMQSINGGAPAPGQGGTVYYEQPAPPASPAPAPSPSPVPAPAAPAPAPAPAEEAPAPAPAAAAAAAQPAAQPARDEGGSFSMQDMRSALPAGGEEAEAPPTPTNKDKAPPPPAGKSKGRGHAKA